jgi:hypothetical protein
MRARFHEKKALLCTSRSERRDGSISTCPHRATYFELCHGRLRLAVCLCSFHFEELGRLVKGQGKDWGATACDWRDARLWAASKGLKSGL